MKISVSKDKKGHRIPARCPAKMTEATLNGTSSTYINDCIIIENRLQYKSVVLESIIAKFFILKSIILIIF